VGDVGASSLQSTPCSHNIQLLGPLKQVHIQHEVCHCLSGTTPDFTATWTISWNKSLKRDNNYVKYIYVPQSLCNIKQWQLCRITKNCYHT